MTSVDPILYQAQDHLARLTLNRPEKRNALNADLIAALRQALDRAASDDSVHVVLLTGAGKDFCAGMDLHVSQANPTAADHLNTARQIRDLLLAIRHHRCPVIAAIHGRALGGGAGIASASDLILAAQSASIGYPEVNFGFVPAMVAALLRRSVSEKRTFEYLVSGDAIPADEACRLGLINHVFADEEFAARAEEFASKLAQKSGSALSLTKVLLNHTEGMTLEKALEAGVQMNVIARGTPDAQSGIASFSGAKKP